MPMSCHHPAGTLPQWTTPAAAIIMAMPQNEGSGFCGAVPPTPLYRMAGIGAQELTSLPACDQESVLLQFKDCFSNGDVALAGWSNATAVCEWQGIKCNAEGEVVDM